MAAPNIVNISSIIGASATLALTTSAQSLVSNAASSGSLIKVNSIYVANVDGTNNATLTLNYYSAAALGGTATAICSTITVRANTTVIVIDKNAPIYLAEDKSLGALASASGDLVAVVSYETIS